MSIDYNLGKDEIEFIKLKFPALFANIKPYLIGNSERLVVPDGMTDSVDESFAITVMDYGIKGDEITDDGTQLERIIDMTFMKNLDD